MRSRHPGGLRLTDRAVRKSGIAPGARVLDIGCGDGATVAFLRERGFDARGIDESAENLPFTSGAFGAALLECVLSVLESAPRALKEARRVLRPNGILIVSDVYERGTDDLRAMLGYAGFDIIFKEDHTPALATYAQIAPEARDFYCAALKDPGYALYICRAAPPLSAWAERKLGAAPTRGNINAYQREKLRETAEYARNGSRFYREKLRGWDGVSPLPFTFPADLALDPEAFLCVSPREVARCVTLPTSGTTGRPKRVFFTGDDLELTADFFDFGMRDIARQGGRVTVFMPGTSRGGVGDLLTLGLRRFDCGATVYGVVDDAESALAALVASRADCVVGIPAQMLALARTGGAPDVDSVLLSADYVPPPVISAIENAWNCKVFTHFGMTETGLGGAVECIARRVMHIREPDMIFEIVDAATGEPLPDGETGELVITTLTRRGMPLLRYRTGDIASVIPGECDCGCELKRLGRVRRAGAANLSQRLDDALFALPFVRAFGARRAGAELEITVELVSGAPAGSLAEIADTARRVSGMSAAARDGRVEWKNGSIKRNITGI